MTTLEKKLIHIPFRPLLTVKTDIFHFRFFYLAPALRSMAVYSESSRGMPAGSPAPNKTYSIHWPHTLATVVSNEADQYGFVSIGLSGLREAPKKPYEKLGLIRLPFPNLNFRHQFCGTFKEYFEDEYEYDKEMCKDFLDQIIYAPWVIENTGHWEAIEEAELASNEDPHWYNNRLPWKKFKPDFTAEELTTMFTM